jgi:4-aminobutyrate aminotransferase-like enzyme
MQYEGRSSRLVQGSGLFMRVELVKDRATKEPLARKVTERIFMECVRRGLRR